MVNDYFLGSEMSALTGDKFAKRFIEDDMLEEDIVLMDHKWWDYRVWHPSKATYYFFHVYNEIAVDFIRKHIGDDEANQYRRSTPHFKLHTRPVATIRAIWKARMAADALGVPYETYIRIALTNFYDNYHILATTKRAKREQRLPYPAQLTSKFIFDRVIKEWSEETRARVVLPESQIIRNDPNLWFRADMEASIQANCDRAIDGPGARKYATRLGLLTDPT